MKKLLYLVPVAIMASCQAPAPESAASDPSDMNMQLTQRFYDEVLNAHNPAMTDSFCAVDVVDHQADASHPEGIRGLDNLRAMFADLFTGYPDLHVTVNFMVASGDTVVVHNTMTGTNSGPMAGMEPTNKAVNFDGVDIIVVRDGKCVEHWGYYEEMKMMTQLGLMPAPGAPSDSTAAMPAEGMGG